MIGRTSAEEEGSCPASEHLCLEGLCDAAHARFLENHVQGLEKELRQRDLTRLVNNTRKVRLKYIRDEEGRMLPDPGLILGRWTRFFGAPQREI